MKKIAVVQSNYIPWKGYFDLINSVDEFILYDDMQYTRRDWRNRNRIKTSGGLHWLTIPVEVKGNYFQTIQETKIADARWGAKHWKTILQNYSKAPFFNEYKEFFEPLYRDSREHYLSDINYRFIIAINSLLGITTTIRFSSEFTLSGNRTEKLLNLCDACNAAVYLSGPSAKAYFDETLSAERGIRVEWMDYGDYPRHHQLYPPFEHGVSIIDLLFNEGYNTPTFMKSFKER